MDNHHNLIPIEWRYTNNGNTRISRIAWKLLCTKCGNTFRNFSDTQPQKPFDLHKPACRKRPHEDKEEISV